MPVATVSFEALLDGEVIRLTAGQESAPTEESQDKGGA